VFGVRPRCEADRWKGLSGFCPPKLHCQKVYSGEGAGSVKFVSPFFAAGGEVKRKARGSIVSGRQ
jgi:hypothetical protein